MPGTRSQHNQLEEFVDNPEDLARKKKSNMAEQPRNDENTNTEGTEDTEDTVVPTPTPTPTLYLPDMKNTPLAEAKKRAIQWGNNTDEYLVECPEIEKYYGDGTLLVDFTDGSCQLYMGGELEAFPIQASENPFPLSLLEKILVSDAKQCIVTSDLPGTGLSTIITKPMTWDQVGCRTEIFAQLVGMYASNQISLQHASLLPKKQAYKEISKYETKGRRIETRLDELTSRVHSGQLSKGSGRPEKVPPPQDNPNQQRNHDQTPSRKVLRRGSRKKPSGLQSRLSTTKVNHTRPQKTSWRQQRLTRPTARVATLPHCHQPPRQTTAATATSRTPAATHPQHLCWTPTAARYPSRYVHPPRYPVAHS